MIVPLQEVVLCGGNRMGDWLSSIDRYHPGRRQVASAGSMPSARGYGAAAAIGRSVYIMGGGNGSSWLQSTLRYDADLGRVVEASTGLALLPLQRRDC